MRKLLALAFMLGVATPALSQTYPSPTFQNVTILGSTYFTACSGYLWANGAAASVCYSVIPLAGLPTGTSGATLPVLNAANTWGATQTFGANVILTGHAWGNGTAPAVSSCGTTPALSTGANDNHGTVTSGTGSPTSCTITWATARTNTPDCAVSSPTGTALTSFTPGLTTLVLNFSATSGAKFSYLCLGQ